MPDFVDLHEVHTGPSLQHADHFTTELCAVCKLAEGALDTTDDAKVELCHLMSLSYSSVFNIIFFSFKAGIQIIYCKSIINQGT